VIFAALGSGVILGVALGVIYLIGRSTAGQRPPLRRGDSARLLGAAYTARAVRDGTLPQHLARRIAWRAARRW
jgi:hypothetical protein